MGTRLNKIHLYTCISLWSMWAVGAILFWVCCHNSNPVLASITSEYNSLIPILSIITFEPLIFVMSIIADIKSRSIKRIVGTISLFLITVLLFLAYIPVLPGY